MVPTNGAVQYNHKSPRAPDNNAGASALAGFIDAPEINAKNIQISKLKEDREMLRKKVIDLKQELYDKRNKMWPQEQEKILRDQIVKTSKEAN